MSVSEQPKKFDAQSIDVLMDDGRGGFATVASLDSVGWEQAKDHSIERTLDENAVIVTATGDYNASVVVKATSSSRERLQEMFSKEKKFNIRIKYTPAEVFNSSTFLSGVLTDFSPSDYELDGMPTYTGDYICTDIKHKSENLDILSSGNGVNEGNL